ncbi:MAG: TolC family protein [Deltaproteobacteria bacterium]|nr:TolC family protein [Deltaproteobacteria bacterium]
MIATWLVSLLVPVRVLTLAEAVQTAERHQPQLVQVRESALATAARVGQARAAFLPQVTGTLLYQRATANFAPRPGSLPSQLSVAGQSASFEGFNYFSASLALTQPIYDFGQTLGRYRAAQASARGAEEAARATRGQVLQRVRAAFLQARAQKALIVVTREALANQERHLRQVEGFVEVGTRPAIDLAQSRTDVANARLQAINAENAYRLAKAQLGQAMGAPAGGDFEVADESLPPLVEETWEAQGLLVRAVAARPELASLRAQLEAQRQSLRATRGAYGPSLALSAGFTEAGSQLDAMAWNFSLGVSLSWAIFQGGITRAQVREAEHSLSSLGAQEESLRQQVLFELVQAQLGVRGAQAALGAAGQAVVNARERLRLAEARYQTGAGSGIELGDAQTKVTDAGGQRVLAEYNLGLARAQLLYALGR